MKRYSVLLDEEKAKAAMRSGAEISINGRRIEELNDMFIRKYYGEILDEAYRTGVSFGKNLGSVKARQETVTDAQNTGMIRKSTLIAMIRSEAITKLNESRRQLSPSEIIRLIEKIPDGE